MLSMSDLYILSNSFLSNDEHDDNSWHSLSSCGHILYLILMKPYAIDATIPIL